MIKGKWKLLICTLLVACILFVTSNDVFAAINEDYYYNNVAPNQVVDAQLDNKLKDNVLVDALGSLIYGIGSLLEWVLGAVFKAITGTNIFPWADAILFNAIPFLDVNVFTAAESSLVASLQGFISGMYYTILTLATTFFGIAIMITAIKLVLTAIAEDKAKYKKAIVDWILGLVMLYGIHFFISFALYLNEELVKAASTMASTSLENASENIVALSDTKEFNYEIVLNFCNVMGDKSWTIRDWLKLGGIILGVVLALVVIYFAWPAVVTAAGAVKTAGGIGAAIKAISVLVVKGAQMTAIGLVSVGSIAISVSDIISIAPSFVSLSKEISKEMDKQANNMKDYDTYVEELCLGLEEYNGYEYAYADVSAALLKSQVYLDARFPKDLKVTHNFTEWKDEADEKYIARLRQDCEALTGGSITIGDEEIILIDFYKATCNIMESIPLEERVYVGDNKNYDKEVYELYKTYVNIHEAYVLKSKRSTTGIITNLASYFKETAWTVADGGWKANKSVIQNALMYAILVVQSLIFFIAYAKRLFYVILLILFAPIVVVFDFFTKFGGK